MLSGFGRLICLRRDWGFPHVLFLKCRNKLMYKLCDIFWIGVRVRSYFEMNFSFW